MKNQTNGIGFGKFVSSFNKEFKNDSFDPIAKAIYSFGQLLSYKDSDLIELSKDLTDSYKELSTDQLNIEKGKILEDRLYNILSSSSFLIISNEAYNIISDLNSTTRISLSTDIRLLFSNSNYEKRSALLLHKLLIKYRANEKIESEIFYLDNDDLIDLKNQIEEALMNEENIRNSNEGLMSFIELS